MGDALVDPGLALAVAAVLIALGVLASKVSDRFGIPALLLFLVIGMMAGSEGVGGIDFDDAQLAQGAGVVALAFILFAGGLDTGWASVRPVLRHGLLLATVGVLGTAVVVGLVASAVFDLSLTEGMLLGSIVSSTDAAAVFAVLRSRSVSLKGRLRALLELESGSNDPMAVFLTVALIELITNPDRSVLQVVPLFFSQMGLGALVGYLIARGSIFAINRIRLGYDGLYPVMLIAVVLFTYGAAAMLRGSGFLAVYVAGIVMGNSRFVHKKSLMRFADGLAWLMQIAMFLLLGLLVFPSELWPVAGRALLVAATLMLVPAGRDVRDRGFGSLRPSRDHVGVVGRVARSGADRPRHVSARRSHRPGRADLQRRVLHRHPVGPRAGDHDPARGQVVGCRRAASPAPSRSARVRRVGGRHHCHPRDRHPRALTGVGAPSRRPRTSRGCARRTREPR
jgi:cell volume regulation protein A